jgi:putative addiction module antidote
MYLEVELRNIGNLVNVVLPKETLCSLNVGEGDVLHVTEAAKGGLPPTPAEADFDRQMAVAEEIDAQYWNTLRELAK